MQEFNGMFDGIVDPGQSSATARDFREVPVIRADGHHQRRRRCPCLKCNQGLDRQRAWMNGRMEKCPWTHTRFLNGTATLMNSLGRPEVSSGRQRSRNARFFCMNAATGQPRIRCIRHSSGSMLISTANIRLPIRSSGTEGIRVPDLAQSRFGRKGSLRLTQRLDKA